MGIGAVLYQGSPLGAIQMLWVNLVMDSLGSLALATEKPKDDLLLRKPYGQNESMISRTMWWNMLGQSVYQLAVVLLTLFWGEYLFYDEDGERATNSAGEKLDHLKIGRAASCDYTQHYTCLFNVFVVMTLFNQVAARKLKSEMWLLGGIFDNMYFFAIVLMEAAGQTLFVQVMGKAVGCYKGGLTGYQWGLCIAFGFGCWIWQLPLNFLCVYTSPDEETLLKQRRDAAKKLREEEYNESLKDEDAPKTFAENVADTLSTGAKKLGQTGRRSTNSSSIVDAKKK